MATLKNTIAKAEKVTGQKVVKENNEYVVMYKGQRVSFMANGRVEDGCEAICFYTCKQKRSFEDQMTDYWSGTFHDNLSQCFKFIDQSSPRVELIDWEKELLS